MPAGHGISAILFICIWVNWAQAQEVTSASAPAADPVPARRPAATAKPFLNGIVDLTVPKGTAVQVVLDKEVRIQKVGQAVHGRLVEPVYAFDKLVVPVGAEVWGRITRLESVSGGKRTLEALNADFTPPRKVQVEFDEIVLLNSRRIPMHTTVTPGSAQVIQFVTTPDGENKEGIKAAASKKVNQAKEEAKREWDDAMKQVQEPGKMRRLERYAVSQLPVHPQYIAAGTVYFAELEDALEFGTEPLTPELASSIGTLPPGSLVHVRLMTPLSSATSQNGEEVEAVLSQPLFDGNRLLLPQGSRLKGSVVQVRPARRLSRNGQLRMVFHELLLPDGIQRKVDTTLESIQSGKGEGVKLDSEGGAEASSPKTRYLATGISVALALASSRTDADARDGDAGGNTSNRVAGGAGGFKLIGIALGVFVHSQPLGMAMGAYGASVSIYAHFIARGRDVVFPKNTAMDISVTTRSSTAAPSPTKLADPGATKQ